MKLLDYNLNALPDHQTLVLTNQYSELLAQIDNWEIIPKRRCKSLFLSLNALIFVSANEI